MAFESGLWVPAGFAHGFLVTSETAQFLYKTTDFYSPENERAVMWNDPTLNIAWPLTAPPILSKKDTAAHTFDTAELFG
ncbi:dTDP-4-dehydrorhamnose 3,5-epimerase [Agrobacterium vaccinii]|uniref:dTDP-4-dehydrorhamnose 3,5-epimerase n=2 Tax=Agrobacterium TaxID=357 RepID=UPI00321F9EDC